MSSQLFDLSAFVACSTLARRNGIFRSNAEISATLEEEAKLSPQSEVFVLRTLKKIGLRTRKIHAAEDVENGKDYLVFHSETGISVLSRSEENWCTLNEQGVGTPIEWFENGSMPSQQSLYEVTALTDSLVNAAQTKSNTVKRSMFSAMLRSRAKLAKILVSSIIANILAVAISLYALQIYDRVLPNQSIETLIVLTVGVLIAVVFEASLRILRSLLVDDVGIEIEKNTLPVLIRSILGARLSDSRVSPSNLVNLTREMSSIRELFTATATSVIADIPFVFIFIGVIHLIGGYISFLIMGGTAAIIGFALITKPLVARITEDLLAGNANGTRVINEVAYGKETIKTLGGENIFIRRWREVQDFNMDRTSKYRAVAGINGAIAAGIQQAVYVCVMATAAFSVFDGEFTAGTMIALSILTSRTLAPVTQLAGAITRWEQMKSGVKSINTLMATAQERPAGKSFLTQNKLSGNVTLVDAEFAYPGSQNIQFKCKRFDIKPGERIGILGQNGSGKTALLKALSGHYDLAAGSLTLNGTAALAFDPDDRRAAIGYLPQDVRLFYGTVRDNLTLGHDGYTEDQLLDALKFSGALRGGEEAAILDLHLSDGGEGLSGGQRQAIGLAQLHLRSPQLVLLDEPTASLDQMTERALVRKFETWLEGRTAVIATHRLAMLDLVDRIVVLQDGEVRMDGPKDAVLRQLSAQTREQ